MKIAWIGLGNMGLPMATNPARRARDVGDELAVYDVDEAARASAHANGLAVARDMVVTATAAEVVFAMLPKGAIVADVLGQVLPHLAPGAVVVDCSTIASTDVVELHGKAQVQSIRFIDGPVSDGADAAGATLTFMVGASADDLAEVTPLLEAMGIRILYAGEVGRAQDAKVVNNLMLAINMQSLSESARLADSLGLDHRTLVGIAAQSSGDSWMLRSYYPVPDVVDTAPAGRNFEAGFATELTLKDLRLALAAATHHGLTTPEVTLVESRLQTLVDQGAAPRDFSILVRDSAEPLSGEYESAGAR